MELSVFHWDVYGGRKIIPDCSIVVPILRKSVFIIFSLLGAACYYFYSPSESIFKSAYGESISVARMIHFSGLQSFGLAFLTICFLDMLFYGSSFKRVLFFCTMFMSLYFQVIGGDRDIFTVLVAFLLFYFISRGDAFDPLRLVKICLSSGLVFGLLSFVGSMRGRLFDSGVLGIKEIIDRFVNSILFATWTPVLLTAFGASLKTVEGKIEYLLGKTYVDLFLSLIPGPVAHFIGYSRPLVGDAAPAWWFKEYGFVLGGCHAFVVPYMNFGFLGVFIVMFFYSFLIDYVERKMRRNYFYIMIFVVMCASVPHWFYYGEMYVIRNLMALFIVIGSVKLVSLFKIKRTSLVVNTY